MANSKIIGHVTCPHCGNENATVHQQQKGRKVLYYRCYTAIGGTEMQCGTVQILGPKGQDWIIKNMRAVEPVQPPKPAEKPAPIVPENPIAPEPVLIEPEPAQTPIADEQTPTPIEPETPQPPEQTPIPPEQPVKRSLWEILTTEPS